MLQQPLGVRALGVGPDIEQTQQQKRQLFFSGPLPLCPASPSLSQAAEQRAQNPVGQAHGYKPCHGTPEAPSDAGSAGVGCSC